MAIYKQNELTIIDRRHDPMIAIVSRQPEGILVWHSLLWTSRAHGRRSRREPATGCAAIPSRRPSNSWPSSDPRLSPLLQPPGMVATAWLINDALLAIDETPAVRRWASGDYAIPAPVAAWLIRLAHVYRRLRIRLHRDSPDRAHADAMNNVASGLGQTGDPGVLCPERVSGQHRSAGRRSPPTSRRSQWCTASKNGPKQCPPGSVIRRTNQRIRSAEA